MRENFKMSIENKEKKKKLLNLCRTVNLRLFVEQWAQCGRTVDYLGIQFQRQRPLSSGSLKNSRNSLSCARQAASARGYKLVLQCGCSDKSWLRICVCSGVGSVFASLSTSQSLLRRLKACPYMHFVPRPSTHWRYSIGRGLCVFA